MVLFNQGAGRSDATCNWLPISPPHLIAGVLPTTSERLFASGNERTKVILEAWNFPKVGYKVKESDKFSLIVDLMNENMQDKQVYLTMTYDFVDGHPEDYDSVRPVWFDVAQCLTSEWPAPYNDGNYTIPSMTWKANFDGDIIGAIGHLHDGGQRISLDVDGKRVCNSDASYGTSPEFVSKMKMGNANSATEHISDMTSCVNEKMGITKLVKGQTWKLKAEYDYVKNKGNVHENGKQSNVMGIAIMWVKVKK
jgi:Stress up-regulated Nod 19